MGWEPASWLAFARTFQVLTCFGAIGLHGFLTIRIYTSEIMVALTLLVCLTSFTNPSLSLIGPGR